MLDKQTSKLGARMHAFFDRRTPSASAREALDFLGSSPWDLYAFGGFPRDLYLEGPSAEPKDLDLVAVQATTTELESWAEPYPYERNRFGGLKVETPAWTIDIWPLESTWAFSERHVEDCEIEDLPRTTFLDIEAVVVELFPAAGDRKVYSKGFFEAAANKTIDLNLPSNPAPAVAIARALLLATHLDFAFGPSLDRFVRGFVDEFGEAPVRAAVEGRAPELTRASKRRIDSLLRSCAPR